MENTEKTNLKGVLFIIIYVVLYLGWTVFLLYTVKRGYKPSSFTVYLTVAGILPIVYLNWREIYRKIKKNRE